VAPKNTWIGPVACGGIDHLGNVQSLAEEADAAVDREAASCRTGSSILRAIPVGGRPGHDPHDLGPLDIEQMQQFVLQPLAPGRAPRTSCATTARAHPAGAIEVLDPSASSRTKASHARAPNSAPDSGAATAIQLIRIDPAPRSRR
jgi:hypothetical protein